MTGKWLEWCILCCATFLVVIYTWPPSTNESFKMPKAEGNVRNSSISHNLSDDAKQSPLWSDKNVSQEVNQTSENDDQSFQQLAEISARNSSSANRDSEHPEIRHTKTASQKSVQKPVTWLQLVRAEMLARPADLIREHPTFYFGVGQEPFLRASCPVSSCYITTNRTEVPYQQLDALVWISIENDKSFPPVRSPHTRYIYYEWEPPLVAGLGKKQLDSLKYVFNYTMTYRRDSDIFNPYGTFRALATPRAHLRTKDYARGKSKQAVWFVSNCGARSGRD
ncbi:uncharacterized protein LOC108675342, partial [Hyalella azteca]|uniref:Uncharacterized protein LOC108675342 n=1 Tax=Hyalella azteca TaxID=294128 RepID=A0A979FJP7_HYAAZ